jgi:hypothetical protein
MPVLNTYLQKGLEYGMPMLKTEKISSVDLYWKMNSSVTLFTKDGSRDLSFYDVKPEFGVSYKTVGQKKHR